MTTGDFIEKAKTLPNQDYISERALASFENSVKNASLSFDLTALKSWISDMLRIGRTYSTQKRYLGKIHALYCALNGKASDTEKMFAIATSLLSKEEKVKLPDFSENIRLIRQAARKPAYKNASFLLYLRIFLYSLYNAGEDIRNIVSLTRNSLPEMCAQAQKIVDESVLPQRKYVFALEQGRKSDNVIVRETLRKIGAVLTSIGIKLNKPFDENTIAEIWIEVARMAGIEDNVIAAVAGQNTELPAYLRMIEPAVLTPEQRYDTLCAVADYIHDTTEKWYVMNLRNNKPADIEERLAAAEGCPVKKLHTFYPCEKIVVKDGKKKRIESRPVIREILFFKTRPEYVKPIFRAIGDLAWCFRANPSDPDSPYSVVNSRQMELFQICICQFSDDMEISVVSAPEIMSGQKVRITGGIMEGYEGIVIDSSTDGNNMRTFGLQLANNSTLTWKVDIDERFIELIR
ncbi:MAG: hypothetical protein K2I18_03165 [Paramuribaculum sp.]|nr:hypothetical protein [Paramuribaculum sp.]